MLLYVGYYGGLLDYLQAGTTTREVLLRGIFEQKMLKFAH